MDEDEVIDVATATEREFRVLPTAGLGIETRALGDGTSRDYFTGCAVKFGVRSQLLSWFVEIIDPSALADCDMSDVVGLFNHANDNILGRTTAGTLELELRANDGLYYHIPYDETDPDHVRVKRKIDKKEVTGSSFQFSIAVRGQEWDTDPTTGVEVRTITKIAKLYDVGPVTFPAYLDSTSGVDQRAKRDRDSAVSEGRMKGMGKKKEKKADPTYDETFLGEMIPHHQMAIDMATVALDKAEHQDLKDLAQTIIDTQTAEIAKMEGWKSDWFGEQKSKREQTPPAANQDENPDDTWQWEAESRARELEMY